MSQGTPKTLRGAILNAIEELELSDKSEHSCDEILAFHVKDFLAQHFMIALGRIESHDPKDVLKALYDRVGDLSA